MSEIERIKFAMAHLERKSAVSFNRIDWIRLVGESGESTHIDETPQPLTNVMEDACVMAVAASGTCNPDPGIDVVRYDPRDAPYIYNIDHYTVIENLVDHPDYKTFIQLSNIHDSEGLRQLLRNNVFIVGPKKLYHHHVKEIPKHIKNAKSKK